ncbi:MAG: substrate-binding domain-containing protein, partial [Bacillota bacterium]
KKPGEMISKVGLAMVYGTTIPTTAPNKTAAVAFMKFLLGAEGQEIMSSNGQPSIAPADVNDVGQVPEKIKPLVN